MNYQLKISLSAATLNQLSASGLQMYGFLAAQVSDARSMPLVWYVNSQLGMNTLVTWSDNYQVYTSHSAFDLPPEGTVVIGDEFPMSPGQLLTVDQTGSGLVTNDGTPGLFSVYNSSTTPQLCGLLAQGSPFCALPLDGIFTQEFAPIPQLLILFAPDSYPTGTIIEQWTGTSTAGILVDLSNVGSAQVSFDINDGWSWNNQTWGQQIRPGSDLTQFLLP